MGPRPVPTAAFSRSGTLQLSGVDNGILSKLKQFEAERNEEAVYRLRLVSVWAGAGCVFSMFLFALGMAVGLLTGRRAVGRAVMAVAAFGLACGVVQLSTCPFKKVQVDNVLKTRARLRVALGLGCAALSVLFGLSAWPHFLCVPSALCLAVGRWQRVRCWPRASASFSSWFGMYILAGGLEAWFSGSTFHVFALAASLSALAVVLVFNVASHWRSKSEPDVAWTRSFYGTLYMFMVWNGTIWLLRGAEYSVGGDTVLAVLAVFDGFCKCLPVVVVLLAGRHRLFKFVIKVLDRRHQRRQRDGAFVASVLDGLDVKVGEQWWVHRKSQDEQFAPGDHRRCWREGVIMSISPEGFEVQLRAEKSKSGRRGSVAVAQARGGKSAEALLSSGLQGLRYLEWEHVSLTLFTGVEEQDWFSHSKVVPAGSHIEYFLSHSWHDDGEAKWNVLQHVAADFSSWNMRSPSFWIDRACIKQDSICEGLRLLPVNLMSCNKVLVMWGPTYPSRLWCVWELFTVFAFTDVEQALSKLQIESLGSANPSIDLQGFDYRSAKCYDPNELRQLQRVIVSLGASEFNGRIQQFGAALARKTSSSSKLTGRLAQALEAAGTSVSAVLSLRSSTESGTCESRLAEPVQAGQVILDVEGETQESEASEEEV